jgi:hypothetical protein
MYSGSTLTKVSGRILGAHQKIDRIARHHLELMAPAIKFPSARYILRFEGVQGPDAIKRKSPAKDEPWHYFQPFDENDDQLIHLIEDHYKQLVAALVAGDDVRAAFEAAWLAHAVVDGLTPAHHYPYEEKLVELRSGKSKETRTTIKEKLVMPGETRSHQLKNNWKMWGPKGLFTTHGAFEWGVATLMAPLRLRRAVPSADDIEDFLRQGPSEWYRQTAQDIARLQLYDAFYASGWTLSLAYRIRRQLAPELVRAVTLIWYGAAKEAGVTRAAKQ